MARIRRLSAPPIQEALIDFVISGRSLAEAELRDLAEDAKGDANWLVEDLRRIEATLDVTDVESFSGSQTLEGIRAKAPDESVVIAFRSDRVTVSHVRSYHCWEDLQELALRSLGRFLEKSGDALITRIATRFINVLSLGANIADTLTMPPSPPIEGGQVTDFSDQRVVKLPDGLTLVVRQATAMHKPSPEAPPSKAILVDVDAFCECSIQPADVKLVGVLSQLRDAKNQVFFGAVTEAALENC